jgi:acyl-homoserine lactone acylase PvdQ
MWFYSFKKQLQATLFYISIHTLLFFFRPEVQVHSEEGLNVYSAVTWGQFFIYQGFNDYCGWMHTSSNVDVADMYAEKIVRKKTNFMNMSQITACYRKNITINYLENGKLVLKIQNLLHHPRTNGSRGKMD